MTAFKLNHLNICVTDPELASQFFVDHFGFKRLNEAGLKAIAVIRGQDGFVLNFANFDKAMIPVYPDGFHFGFILDSRKEVDATFERLRAAGVATEPPKSRHGSWTFYFDAPGGTMMEVQCAA